MYFCKNTLSPPLVFHVCHSCRALFHVGAFDITVARCLATCAQLHWEAGPWQGVSWYVRSDLCDYSLTCCLPDWHSVARSANHTLSQGLGNSVMCDHVTAVQEIAASVTRTETQPTTWASTQVVRMVMQALSMSCGFLRSRTTCANAQVKVRLNSPYFFVYVYFSYCVYFIISKRIKRFLHYETASMLQASGWVFLMATVEWSEALLRRRTVNLLGAWLKHVMLNSFWMLIQDSRPLWPQVTITA